MVHTTHRDYCSHLTGYCKQCEEMLTQLSRALDALQDMTDKHQLVSQRTQALHDACEKLVEEQVRHASLSLPHPLSTRTPDCTTVSHHTYCIME